jgi:hypothetical protein
MIESRMEGEGLLAIGAFITKRCKNDLLDLGRL